MIASEARVVYVVRHGRTTLNAEGRLRGHLDPPLDEFGLEEVGALGEAFAALPVRPARVVSGPLQRTRRTAEAIARPCGIDFCIEPRLVDRDYGPWTGAPSVDLRARFGSALADLPDAEPLDAVSKRAREVLDEQVQHLSRGPVVLVAHDAVNSLLLSALDPSLGTPDRIQQETACWNSIEMTSTGWVIGTVNGNARTL